MDQLRVQLQLGSFKVPLAPEDFGNTPTATPSPSVEPFVWDVEHRIV